MNKTKYNIQKQQSACTFEKSAMKIYFLRKKLHLAEKHIINKENTA